MKHPKLIIGLSIVAALALAGAAWFWSGEQDPPVNSHSNASVIALGEGMSTVVRTTSTVPYPNPFGSPKEIMEGIYAADHDQSAVQLAIKAVIVPHHIVAAEDIALGIKALQGQDVKDIVLISPDHYSQCPSLFCTTDESFETGFGTVMPSSTELAMLSSSNLVTLDRHLFIKEHGIYSILPFIKYYLPDVRVTPLAISLTRHWKSQQASMADLLDGLLGEGTVLVVSSDFSHYLTLDEAQAKDAQTIKTIESGNLDKIAALENPAQSDCPACLWSLAQYAKKQGYYHPAVLMHTNSALILKQPDIPETTSHFTIVWN